MTIFRDRTHAGEVLADRLAGLPHKDTVVYALPRGGVPVALPVAARLDAPLDLLLVRKIGLPGQPEVAAGAVVDGAAHDVVFNQRILRAYGLSEADFDATVAEKLAEIEARRTRYLAGRPPSPATGRRAIVVDDGIATGATVKAALKALRRRAPEEIILAVPVAPADTLDELSRLVDQVVCLETPGYFRAVGAQYEQFGQVSDDEVTKMLQTAQTRHDMNDDKRERT